MNALLVLLYDTGIAFEWLHWTGDDTAAGLDAKFDPSRHV
jgi:hypothetical protein